MYSACWAIQKHLCRTNNMGPNTFFTPAVFSTWAGKDTELYLTSCIQKCSVGVQLDSLMIVLVNRFLPVRSQSIPDKELVLIFIPRNKVTATLLNKTSNLTIKLTANCASYTQDTLTVLTILSIFYLILDSV